MTEQEFKKAISDGYTRFVVNQTINVFDYPFSDIAIKSGDIVDFVEINKNLTIYPVKCRYKDMNVFFAFSELDLFNHNDLIQEESAEVPSEKADKSVELTPLLNQHYAKNEIQPIEFIQQVLRDNPNINPFEGACLKDIIKYSSRYGLKDEKIKEAKKIVDYSLWLLLEAMGIKVEPMKHNHSNILKGFNL